MASPTEEKLRIYQLICQHEGWAQTLEEALKVEEEGAKRWIDNKWVGNYYGFEWFEVHTPAATLNKMVTDSILNITLSTRSGTHYKVREPGLVKEAIEALHKLEETPVPKAIPDDLFNIILGHDNIKQIVRYAIDSERPVHFLFSGPPASAKTLFLMELARLPEAYYCLAQTSSQSGLSNVLFTYQPRFLLIDEIDRLNPEHVGVLNSLMATGIVSESKYGKTRSLVLNTKVFAAGIKVHLLPGDLLTRFTPIRFDAYVENEFLQVAIHVLVTLENINKEVAEYIAQSVWKINQMSSDIRRCVQIARLCNGDMDRAREVVKLLGR